MSTIRIRKEQNYFAASNVPFNDARLSWEARGVLGYLLSKPDDWTVRFTDLVNRGPAGEHKVRRILKELEELEYLERIRIQNEGGKFEWISTIYEIPPTISRLSTDGLPICGLSIDGSPIYGKPPYIVSTDLPSTDLPSTDESNTEEEEPAPPPSSPISIAGIVANATGMVTIPPKEMARTEQIHSLIDYYGVEDVTKVLREQFNAWIKTKSQNGSYYRRTNFGWVDWAQEALANGGDGAAQKDIDDMSTKEFQEMLRQQAEAMA